MSNENMKKTVNGQSLFELLFALAIVSLIIVGVVSLVSKSVRNESYSQNLVLATKYSQQSIEWIRGERDSDWFIFSTTRAGNPGMVWCLSDLSWPGVSGSCGPSISGTIFSREIVLTLTAVDVVEVVATVTWSDSQGDHDIRSVTQLTGWIK